MIVVTDVAGMQRTARALRCDGKRVALVPTMGALHAGHLSLVQLAKDGADAVVVSIFVNPSQFGPTEDYARYPRDLESDLRLLMQVGGVDVVFAPTPEEMYPGGAAAHVIRVVPGTLADHLCGRSRPGHFDGVATVVTKLFNACLPDIAVFGRKDAQQFVILSRLARELDFGIEIVGAETVREADGLALSSRNMYLNDEERHEAAVLHRALMKAARLIEGGELDARAVVDSMAAEVTAGPLARLQYAEVVDAESLHPIESLTEAREVIAALAVYFGETRLIDNVFVRPGSRPNETQR